MKKIFLFFISSLVYSYCSAYQIKNQSEIEDSFPTYQYENKYFGEGLINIDCTNSEATPINLTKALILAICNSQNLASLYYEIKIKEAELGENESLYYPKIQFSTSKINARTIFPNSNNPAISNNSNPSQLLMQILLYDFGQKENRLAIGQHEINYSIANYYNGLQSVIDNTATYFFQRNKSLIVYEESQKKDRLLNVLLKITMAREQLGQAKTQDVLRIKNEINQNVYQLLKYKEELYLNSVDLFQILGIDYKDNLYFNHDYIYGTAINLEIDQLINSSLTTHPSLVGIMEKWLSDRKNIKLAKSLSRPTIDLKGNIYFNGRADQNDAPTTKSRERNINFTLTVPIFDGYANESKVNSAIAQSEKTLYEWSLQEQKIKKEIVYNFIIYTNAQKNLELKNQLLESHRKLSVFALVRFNRGVDSINEVINSLSLFIEAEIESLKAQVELKQAEVKLFLSAGRFEYIINSK